MKDRSGVLTLSLSRFLETLGAGAVFIALPCSVGLVPAAGAEVAETTRIGLLTSVFGFALAAAQPAAGLLADRGMSRRGLALAGLAWFAVTTVALGYATTYRDLIVLRALQGLGMGLVVPTSASLVAGLAAPERQGSALGFYASVKMLGLGLGPVLGGALLAFTTPGTTYWFAALLVLLSCVPLFFLEPGGEPPRRGADSPRTSRRATGKITAFLALGFGGFVASSSATSLAVLQNEFAERIGQTTLGFGLAFAAMLLTRMLLNWPVGRIADRVSGLPLLLAGLLVLAAGTLLLGYARSTGELVVLRIAMGFGMALFSIPCLALVTRARRDQEMTFCLSLVTTGFSLGVGLGPLLTGVCAGQLGFQAPFVFWSAMGLVAALLSGATLRRLAL